MVLEQDAQGHASHRAADLSAIGEGLDPVLQFILLNTPTERETAQVLWEASDEPIPWVKDSDDRDYRFVDYVVLPEGSSIEYRVYLHQPELEIIGLRHTRTEGDQDYYMDSALIDVLPIGQYNLMARLVVPDRPIQTITQRLDVVEFVEEPDSEDDLNPSPIASESDSIKPGSGWTGKTRVPKQIGNSKEPAIAHWNVVPEQQATDGFTVGVIAHHLDGIDYVEISANNGPWVRINNSSINPRTQCEEYWTTLDLSSHNGEIELRAIAIPKSGKPVLVKPMGATYSKQDLTLHTNVVGEVIELDAGVHTLGLRPLPETGWLIVRPKPGVAREDVILERVEPNWKQGRLKLENLTIKLPSGGSGLRGNWATRDNGQHLWLDECNVIGNGPKNQTWWTGHLWETFTMTDTEVSHVQSVVGNLGLIRNCYFHHIYEDIFRTPGLHVNVTIEDMDRSIMTDAQPGAMTPHPDIWQSQNLKNTIAQDITAIKNINGQGFFPKDTSDVALVRVNIKTVSPYRAIQIMGEAQNLLIDSCKIDGSSALRGSLVGRLKQRGNVDGNGRPWTLELEK